MKIPKRFNLLNRTWRVKIVDEVHDTGGRTLLGKCLQDEGILLLSKKENPNRVCLEHTFCHELMHVLWLAFGIDVEDHDEGKIDAQAAMLHQALNSFRGEQ